MFPTHILNLLVRVVRGVRARRHNRASMRTLEAHSGQEGRFSRTRRPRRRPAVARNCALNERPQRLGVEGKAEKAGEAHTGNKYIPQKLNGMPLAAFVIYCTNGAVDRGE